MPSPLELLESKGIKIESLNPAERETLQQWYEALAKNQVTLENVKDYLKRLIEAVEKDLSDLKESTSLWSHLFNFKRDIYLKARLKNYLLLSDFLTGPERAKKAIEQTISNIKPK